MATKPTIRRSSTVALGTGPLVSGPWKGVFDTVDPFDLGASDNKLAQAKNCYIPDAQGGSGVYARNGFAPAHGWTPLTTSVLGPLYGQAVYAHHMLDGTVLNFVVVGGKLLRLDSAGATTATDVTPPLPITMNTGNTPVYLTSMVANIGGVTQTVLIVSDGNVRPWVGTNLTSTPITGTYIDYDGAGVEWTAYGQPVVWQGALFCILKSVGGVARREDIGWSEPGDPFTGWQQPASDNNMTLVLAGAPVASGGPLTAIVPTNVALYYFRAHSIGAIAGAIDALTTANTLDVISFNIGTTACRTIQQFGTAMFFADNWGRPYMLHPGNPPMPIWKQMRNVVRNWGSNGADQLQYVSSSVIEPTHNLYLVALRVADLVGHGMEVPPKTIYAFDALTGNYMGEWTIWERNDDGGIGVSCLGILDNGSDR